MPTTPTTLPDALSIQQAHQLYCRLTGQTLCLAFDRERMWYELLRAGYSLAEVRDVITYLQREIRAQHRNVGALKLSNLLQPDRFEEDLQISRVCLRAPPQPKSPASVPTVPALTPEQQEQGRRRALECLEKLKNNLRGATSSAT